MKLIKNAIIYKATLPQVILLEDHLSHNKFVELGDLEFSRAGFVHSPCINSFTCILPGVGYALNLRYDEKIIPSSVVNVASKKVIAEQETLEDRRLPAKERNAIRDQVFTGMLSKALVKTVEITCFYHMEQELLIVPTASKKLADIVISRLLKAVGSIKTETINIDGLQLGITKKLEGFLEGDDHAFSGFTVGGKCKLKSHEGRSQSFKQADITEAKDGIQEALALSAQVVELELSNNDIEFRITNDFTIKGIHFISELDEETEFDSALDQWKHEAAVQLMLFSEAQKDLVKLFEYKEIAA